jgi:hypothetical protein
MTTRGLPFAHASKPITQRGTRLKNASTAPQPAARNMSLKNMLA